MGALIVASYEFRALSTFCGENGSIYIESMSYLVAENNGALHELVQQWRTAGKVEIVEPGRRAVSATGKVE